jgi:hypothetical protein
MRLKEDERLVFEVTVKDGEDYGCPVCGQGGSITLEVLYLPEVIIGFCDKHKTAWQEGSHTGAGDESTARYLHKALYLSDHVWITDEVREKIKGLKVVDLDEVAWH